MNSTRNGILAAGNFIVDFVKIIEDYPAQDMLASILSESKSNGGGPYNVLCDLSAMQVDYPLYACGLIGDDANGAWIRHDLTARGIDISQLHIAPHTSTSYTDAMTVQHSGRRTFFHHRGANAEFDIQHCELSTHRAKIFHLAYLMLLDRLDEILPNGRSGASLLLEKASHVGMITTLDMVSTEHPQFHQIARSALPFTDYLIINEIEAGRTIGAELAADDQATLYAAAEKLLGLGVRKSVIIHTPHGSVAATRDEATIFQPALTLPANYIKGATGAGDAFAAGMLHGIHADYPLEKSLLLAICAAAASLSHPTPSAGLRSVEECFAISFMVG